MILCALAITTGSTRAMGQPRIAALQVGLQARGLYDGPVDGLMGRATTDALQALERNARLPPSRNVSRAVRAALGAYGEPELGSRDLYPGAFGWDVAELRFLLAWHGFPSSLFNARFGSHLEAALIRFQRWAHLKADGVAGPATIQALHASLPTCPITLAWPLRAPLTSPFGPRGFGFHTGIDLAAPIGTPVKAAAAGTVSWAAFLPGGWGNLVVVDNSHGVQTLFAHLSRIDVTIRQKVATGKQLGLVGATGDATGPHLHFEIRIRGAAINPLPALNH
jgi:hypothetical protein